MTASMTSACALKYLQTSENYCLGMNKQLRAGRSTRAAESASRIRDEQDHIATWHPSNGDDVQNVYI